MSVFSVSMQLSIHEYANLAVQLQSCIERSSDTASKGACCRPDGRVRND